MRRVIASLIVIAAMLAAVPMPTAFADTINFDDLATPNTGNVSDWGVVPASYGGLTWTGWEVTRADGQPGSYQTVYGNTYGAPSLKNFAYNGGDGNYQVTTSAVPFYFLGAEVSSFVLNNTYQTWSSENLTLQGYLGSNLVDTKTVSLSNHSFDSIAGLSGPIDKLVFTSDGAGEYWGLDNFQFAPVPAPSAIAALMGLGGMGLVGLVWRRRRPAA